MESYGDLFDVDSMGGRCGPSLLQDIVGRGTHLLQETALFAGDRRSAAEGFLFVSEGDHPLAHLDLHRMSIGFYRIPWDYGSKC